jgi:prevent-host-death family protein
MWPQEGVVEIGIRELRDGLSRHLAEVRRGATVTVTDHGQPIARIVPVERLSRLEQLRAEGRVRSATRRKRPAPDPVEGSGTVSDLVDDQRR